MCRNRVDEIFRWGQFLSSIRNVLKPKFLSTREGRSDKREIGKVKNLRSAYGLTPIPSEKRWRVYPSPQCGIFLSCDRRAGFLFMKVVDHMDGPTVRGFRHRLGDELRIRTDGWTAYGILSLEEASRSSPRPLLPRRSTSGCRECTPPSRISSASCWGRSMASPLPSCRST